MKRPRPQEDGASATQGGAPGVQVATEAHMPPAKAAKLDAGATPGSASGAALSPLGAWSSADSGAAASATAGGAATSAASSSSPPLPPSVEALEEEYVPGCLIMAENNNLVEVARSIGRDLGASFEDPADVDAVRAAEATFSAAKARLAAAEQAAGASSASSSASSSPAVVAAQADVAAAKAAFEDARRGMLARVRRAVRDGLLRVTLVKDASEVNAHRSLEGLVEVKRRALVCPNPRCRNADEGTIFFNPKEADHTCGKCGFVVAQIGLLDGDWTRNLEDKESTSQIGPAANPLLSSGFNLRTGIGMAPGVSSNRMRLLREVQDKVEIDHSSGIDAVTTERRTRQGYKDQQKMKQFEKLQAEGLRQRLPEATIQRAKVLFAAFRDNRELVTNLEETVACCLIAAVEEAAFEERKELARHAASVATAAAVASKVAAESQGPAGIQARVARPLDPERARALALRELEAKRRAEKLGHTKSRFMSFGGGSSGGAAASKKGKAGDDSDTSSSEDEETAEARRLRQEEEAARHARAGLFGAAAGARREMSREDMEALQALEVDATAFGADAFDQEEYRAPS